MFNALKRKISDNCYAANIAIILLVVIGGGLAWHTLAQASISGFTIAPTVLGTDDVVAFQADYDVAYTTDSTGIVSEITVTFPDDYTFETSLAHDPSGLIQSDDAVGGNISINGVAQQVTSVTPTGQTLVILLTTPFDYNSTPGASDTVSFRILSQVENTTVARDVDGSEYSIDDDATGNNPQDASATITIIPGPAFTLDFTTLPSMTVPPPDGDIQSGVQWDVQPVVTAHDRYGNVATSYNGDKAGLFLASGDGAFTVATSFDFCSAPEGTYVATAAAGVIDFASAGARYIATVDHEQFTLGVTHLCGSNNTGLSGDGASSTLTADVVASSFAWTQEPGNCSSSLACATQGVITAQDTVIVGLTPHTATDIDFSEEVTLGTDGLGAFLGEVLQGAWVDGVLSTVGLGYTLVDPAVPEDAYFFVQGTLLAQVFTNGTTIALAPATPPLPANPSGAGVYNPNPVEIPVQETAVTPTAPVGNTPPLSSGFGGTSSDSGCAPYLTAYMRLGDRSDQVSRLQTFLAREGSYLEGFITGFFGTLTEKAVSAFQLKYAADILVPQDLSGPTGYAKDYTTSAINKLLCSGTVKL